MSPPPALKSGGGYSRSPLRNGNSCGCAKMGMLHLSASSFAALTWSKWPCVRTSARGGAEKCFSAQLEMKLADSGSPASIIVQLPSACVRANTFTKTIRSPLMPSVICSKGATSDSGIETAAICVSLVSFNFGMPLPTASARVGAMIQFLERRTTAGASVYFA